MEILRREPSTLPVMLMSARMGIGCGTIRRGRVKWGVLELKRELVGLMTRYSSGGSGSNNGKGNGIDGGNSNSGGKKKVVL